MLWNPFWLQDIDEFMPHTSKDCSLWTRTLIFWRIYSMYVLSRFVGVSYFKYKFCWWADNWYRLEQILINLRYGLGFLKSRFIWNHHKIINFFCVYTEMTWHHSVTLIPFCKINSIWGCGSGTWGFHSGLMLQIW